MQVLREHGLEQQKVGEIYKRLPDERGERTDITSETDFPRLETSKQKMMKERDKMRYCLAKFKEKE